MSSWEGKHVLGLGKRNKPCRSHSHPLPSLSLDGDFNRIKHLSRCSCLQRCLPRYLRGSLRCCLPWSLSGSLRPSRRLFSPSISPSISRRSCLRRSLPRSLHRSLRRFESLPGIAESSVRRFWIYCINLSIYLVCIWVCCDDLIVCIVFVIE